MREQSQLWAEIKTALRSRGIFIRNKIPLPLKMLAVFNYLLNPSFRTISRNLDINVSHVSVWSWFHALGRTILNSIFHLAGPARVIVVDETEVQFGGRQIYVWAAIEPESRKIVMLWATYSRSGLTALLFFKRLIRVVGKPDVVITDGGPWYTFALQRLGIRHEIMSGKERNYVERWFETLKDRARCFDVYYPTHKNRLEVLMEWMAMFILYYNHARYHQTLKRPPVPLGGRRERERWEVALLAALSLS